MRVIIYRDDEGRMTAFVQPSPGKGRSPVYLDGITLESVVDLVLPVVMGLRRPKGEKFELPSA